MNKFVKTALVAFVGAFGFTANAQDTGITVKGGLNFNTLSISGSGINTAGLESKLGFHLGALYEAPLTDIFFVETGLLLDTRGFKVVRNDNYDSAEGSINLYALSVPVVAKGKFEVANDVKLFAQAGLFADVLLGGKRSSETTNKTTKETEKYSETIKFGKGEDYSDRFNFGLNFGGGVEYQKFVFSLEYNLGLRDFDEDKDASLGLNAFKIGVGYKF